MTAIRSERTKFFLPKLFNYSKILFSNTESTNLNLEHVVKLSPRELIKNAMPSPHGTKTTKTPTL